MNWDDQVLAGIVGMAISLLFSYFPYLKDWYYARTKEQQSLIMIGVLLVVSAVVFGTSCLNWIQVGVTCDEAGVKKVIVAFVFALIGNQATYSATKNVGRKPVVAVVGDDPR